MKLFTFSLSAIDTDQHIPHPAEIALGTGINLPGISFSLHAFSKAIASVVELKVITCFKVFSNIIKIYGLITFVALLIVSTIVYILVIEPTANLSFKL